MRINMMTPDRGGFQSDANSAAIQTVIDAFHFQSPDNSPNPAYAPFLRNFYLVFNMVWSVDNLLGVINRIAPELLRRELVKLEPFIRAYQNKKVLKIYRQSIGKLEQAAADDAGMKEFIETVVATSPEVREARAMARRQAYVFLVTMAEVYFDDTLRFILSRNPERKARAGNRIYCLDELPQAIGLIEQIFDGIGMPMFAGTASETRYDTYMVYLKRHCLVHTNGKVDQELTDKWRKQLNEACPYNVGDQIEISEEDLKRGAYAIAQAVQNIERGILSEPAS